MDVFVSPLEIAGDGSLRSSPLDARDAAEPERPAGTGISIARVIALDRDGEQVGRTLGRELEAVLSLIILAL